MNLPPNTYAQHIETTGTQWSRLVWEFSMIPWVKRRPENEEAYNQSNERDEK